MRRVDRIRYGPRGYSDFLPATGADFVWFKIYILLFFGCQTSVNYFYEGLDGGGQI